MSDTAALAEGQDLVVLWNWTGGPRTKPVTVERVTPRQILVVDRFGQVDRFWRAPHSCLLYPNALGVAVGGGLHLFTAAEAERTVRAWHAKHGRPDAGELP